MPECYFCVDTVLELLARRPNRDTERTLAAQFLDLGHREELRSQRSDSGTRRQVGR